MNNRKNTKIPCKILNYVLIALNMNKQLKNSNEKLHSQEGHRIFTRILAEWNRPNGEVDKVDSTRFYFWFCFWYLDNIELLCYHFSARCNNMTTYIHIKWTLFCFSLSSSSLWFIFNKILDWLCTQDWPLNVFRLHFFFVLIFLKKRHTMSDCH